MFEKALTDIRVLREGGVSRTGGMGSLRKEDVLLWANESALSISDTFDEVGLGLARAYASGSLDWEFCDGFANSLFGVWMHLEAENAFEFQQPSQFWEVYLAFDYSEIVEPENSSEVARNSINRFLSRVSSGS